MLLPKRERITSVTLTPVMIPEIERSFFNEENKGWSIILYVPCPFLISGKDNETINPEIS
jgi:hypothetical protein